MNLAEFATSNGDFMGGLQSRQDARDTAQDKYEKALETNARNFYYDIANGRPDQIARVVGGQKLTLAGELLDNVDRDALFHLIQSALDGKNVLEMVDDLVWATSRKFAEAITDESA